MYSKRAANEKGGAVLSLSKKVCLLGDFAVGKTSLVRRFVYDLFEDKYLSTIGVKVSRKVVAVPKDDATIETHDHALGSGRQQGIR